MNKLSLRVVHAFILLLLLGCVVNAQAATTDLTGSTGWAPLLKGARFDNFSDTQANKAGTEIVGNATRASAYANYDDNGTAAVTTDDILSLRIRIGDETKATYSAITFFGFDADADGQLEGFFTVEDGATEIYDAGTGSNTSPSTSDIANVAHKTYAQNATNYNFATVSSANDPDWDGNNDLDADGNTDVFVSFSILVSDLDAFLASQGITFSRTTQLRFVALTATQTNSLNADFNGIGDSGTDDWDQSFSDLDIFSPPVDSTGVLGPVFVCQADPYMSTAANSTADTSLYSIVESGGSYSLQLQGTGANYNALGYNVADNYMYAVGNTRNLLRVHSDGTTADLGEITGLPPVDGFRYIAADMDAVGNLYVADDPVNGSSNLTEIYVVDVGTVSVTSTITLSPAITPSPYINDLAYSLADNQIYAFVQDGRLFRIDPSTGTTTFVATTSGVAGSGANVSSGVFGAVFADQAGGLFGIDNNTGDLYSFDRSTGAMTFIATAQSGSFNDGAACGLATLFPDNTAPTLAILGTPAIVNSTTPYSVTFEFSENVTGFEVGDISVGNGSAGSFVAVDSNTYTADITPSGAGDITIDVAAGVAQDAAGNDNTAATQVVTTFDDTAPSLAIQGAPATANSTTPYTVTFEFSEDVSGFAVGDIAVGNGTVSNFVAVDGNTYTATITPSGTGNITIDVAAGAAQDAAGNDNLAATQAVTVFDSVAPTLAIQNAPAIVNSTTPYTVTFEFSENVTGFAVGDISVGNGSAGSFAVVDGNTYTADITPSGAGDITIDVAAGVAQDAAGNGSLAATQAVTVFDSVAPTLAIQNAPAAVTDTTPYSVTFEFSEDVTGFNVGDISVGNGAASNFVTVDGNTYTATITPSGAGNISIDVAAGAAQDAAGNGNLAATQAVTVFDNVAPTLAIQNAPAAVTDTTAYSVTFEFSEDVTGFAVGDISAGNGTAGNFVAVDGNTYTADITPSGAGDITIDVAAGVAQDAAGNDNTAATQVVTTFDAGAPSVNIQNVPAIVADTTPYNVTFEFSEDVTGFVVGDVTVGNGTASNFIAVDGNTYTADITPDGNGDITIDVAAAVAQDTAGNDNIAATQAVSVFDNISPTLAIQNAPAAVTDTTPYSVTFEFSEGVTGFAVGDISVGNGAASNFFAVDGNTYTADITPSGAGNITIDVAAGVAQDGAGNDNIAAAQVVTTFDAGAPSVAIQNAPTAVTDTTPYNVTFEFSEDVTGFVLGDISVGNGAASNFVAVDGNTYTADITPDGNGDITIDVAAGVAQDAVGTDNIEALQVTTNFTASAGDDDNDGVPDSVECPSGPPFDQTCVDSDGDGTPDFQDTDSDNDGISDSVEAGNNPGNPDDTDADGTSDYLDLDSDNDGIPDTVEAGSDPDNPVDTDGDGAADFQDLDSDSDGIPDMIEGGATGSDTDGDGIDDAYDVDQTGGTDANGDGIDDNAGVDTDNDGTPDFQDLDSDSDGIPDAVEGGSTGTDADGDGIDDAYDVDQTGGTDANGDGIDDNAGVDTDNDGTPDFQDLDSDNDGIPDAVEGGASGTDTDGDGIDDAYDVDQTGGTDTNGDGIDDNAGPVDTDGDGTPDYQDLDSDNDGVPDSNDVDADNDGIPDTLEGVGDTDGDGIPDSRDLDSDNDGIPDAVEAGATGVDTDNDGIDDAFDVDQTGGTDANNDGIDDDAMPDSDSDGTPDFQDLDSDDDGIPDLFEGGGSGVDTDGDGIEDAYDADQTGGTDSNGDGIDDNASPDTDADGIPDMLDLDSDADGIPDAIEGGGSGSDTDGDGIDDAFDADQTGGMDLDGNGIDDAVTPTDTDSDGMPDYQDLDSDRDGIPDSTEADVTGLDSDGDGIDDLYDVDQTGGADADGNGVDDAVTPTNTDGDSVPDYRDLDSDNDSLTDVLEAGNQDDNLDGLLDPNGTTTQPPQDTDSDGIADYRDVDSNNDGTNDIVDAGNGLFDANNDGMTDSTVDADGDGVSDVVDAEPGSYGVASDPDNDGVASSVDLDDDNDGIPDAAELDAMGNDVDTDGDGIVDRLDRDSDNDGLPDSVEAVDGTPVDADADGVVDNFVDTNSDGLHDPVDPALDPVDTDADGSDDFRDVDSDDDGLTDLFEASGDATLDTSGDGLIDTPADLDLDGLADAVDPDVSSGTAGTAIDNPDTDSDGVFNFRDTDSDGDTILDNLEAGIDPNNPNDTDSDGTPDYLDLDSDNDGITDSMEVGSDPNNPVDSDGDGIPDFQDADLVDTGKLETAVTGVGSFGMTGLLLLLMLLCLRLGNFKLVKKVVPIAILLLPAIAHSATNYCGRHNPVDSVDNNDFNPCFYVGLGGLVTHVDPEGTAGGWSTSDDNDSGYTIIGGWHFKPRWFGEISYTDLGEAGLSNSNPAITDTETISYEIPSLHAGYLLREPEESFNAYLKAGISAISNDASSPSVPFDKQTSAQFSLGAGLQWRAQSSGLFARLAADFYDRDASAFGVVVGYHFGGSDQTKATEPEVYSTTTTEAVAPQPVEEAPAPPNDRDGDGFADIVDQCPDSKVGVEVDHQGCETEAEEASFTGVLEGVYFRRGSAILREDSQVVLDKAAQYLKDNPLVEVTVVGHTDSDGSAEQNKMLSVERAKSVVNYLQQQGVPTSQMAYDGMGEEQPRADNNTLEGKALNRRVELLPR